MWSRSVETRFLLATGCLIANLLYFQCFSWQRLMAWDMVCSIWSLKPVMLNSVQNNRMQFGRCGLVKHKIRTVQFDER